MTALITALVALWNSESACESWGSQRREHLNPNLKERVIDWCTACRGQRKQHGQRWKCDKNRTQSNSETLGSKVGAPGRTRSERDFHRAEEFVTYLTSDGVMKGFWVEQWSERVWVSEGILCQQMQKIKQLSVFLRHSIQCAPMQKGSTIWIHSHRV